MTMDTETVVVAPAPAENGRTSFLRRLAGRDRRHRRSPSAISLVLLAFGSAIGLSFADFDAGD